MCSESAPSPRNLDHLFEGYSQVHLTSRVVITGDAHQPTAVAMAPKPPRHRWTRFLGDWFNGLHRKQKQKQKHINGDATPRAVERGVDDTDQVCDVSHKTVLWQQLLMFQAGSSVKVKCSQDSTDKQGTMSKWERFVESQKQVWVTAKVPKTLLQPSPWWPGVSFLGPRFSLSPYSRAVLLSTAGLLCKLCRLMQNEGPGCLVLIPPGLWTHLPLTHSVCPPRFSSGGLSPPSFPLPTSLKRIPLMAVWAASFRLYFAHNKEHKNLSPIWCEQRRNAYSLSCPAITVLSTILKW